MHQNTFDFTGQLQRHKLPIRCEGHENAAFGVFIPDKTTLDQYIDFFNTIISLEYINLVNAGKIKSTSISMSYNGCVACDFDFNNLFVDDFLCELDLYHPFGNAFPAPCFNFYVKLNDVEEKMFGNAAQHMKLITNNGLDILLFNMAFDFEWLKTKNSGKDVTFVFNGTFNYDTYADANSKKIIFLANSMAVVT